MGKPGWYEVWWSDPETGAGTYQSFDDERVARSFRERMIDVGYSCVQMLGPLNDTEEVR